MASGPERSLHLYTPTYPPTPPCYFPVYPLPHSTCLDVFPQSPKVNILQQHTGTRLASPLHRWLPDVIKRLRISAGGSLMESNAWCIVCVKKKEREKSPVQSSYAISRASRPPSPQTRRRKVSRVDFIMFYPCKYFQIKQCYLPSLPALCHKQLAGMNPQSF